MASGKVVMNNLAEAEREIGEDVDAGIRDCKSDTGRSDRPDS
jgi:hypothetical protein